MHAADWAVGLEVYVEAVRIEDIVLDVDAFDEADYEAVSANFESAPFGALEADGSLGNARHADASAGGRGQVEVF